MEVPPQEDMVEDISSIYDDLMGQGDLGLIIHNLQIRNKNLQLHVTSLEEDIQKLCDKITEMKQTQENLSRNISELYKTAKNEIDRKDRLIAELQSRLDDMIFKRNTAPSNFGFKRQREEVTRPGETYKRLRSEVKSEQNREQNKDNSVYQSELPKSNYHNKDIKSEVHEKKRSEVCDKKTTEMNQINSDYEVSKNYRNNDTRDNMKHQNFVRNNERKLDIRDQSRYGRDSKRNSNSRNYRRDNERSFRRYNDRERRSSRDRDYKADRFDEYREAKNKNLRDEKLNREHHRSDNREPIGSKREIKNEPRFSLIESTRPTPEFLVEADDLNVSREEGEIVENDSNIEPLSSDKNKYDSEINIHKESLVLCDNKIKNPPTDKIHKYKSIDNNTVGEKKETGGKIIEKHNKGEKLDNKHQYPDKNVKNDMKSIVKEKRDNVQIMENVTCKESLEFVERSLKSVKECELKIISSVDKDSLGHKEKSVEEGGVKTEKITIISQVVLNESKTENVESRVETEVICKEVIEPETLNKIGCSTENKIVKVDKPIRESGVPRNLTGELDINITKSRLVRDKIKELYTDKNERIKKKISSVFDTPIKNIGQNLDKSVNFESSFDITLNGGTTELEKTDAKESVQNNIEIETSTPVSEFQIFKANFQNLEKSNNVKFQTDISNVPVNSAQLSAHKIIESKEFNAEPLKGVQDHLNKNISEGRLPNLISVDLVNTSQTVEKEKMICGNTNDISNISLDLLNTNLAMCKAEDFPNLTSCSESKDMPNLLSTTVSKSSRKHENEVISSKPLDTENISNKPSTNSAVEENIILKGNDANDANSVVPTNISSSPKTGGNTRKRRKRCVIGWAE